MSEGYDPAVSGEWSDSESHPRLPGTPTPAAPSGRHDPNLSGDRVVGVEGETAAEQEARVAAGDFSTGHPVEG